MLLLFKRNANSVKKHATVNLAQFMNRLPDVLIYICIYICVSRKILSTVEIQYTCYEQSIEQMLENLLVRTS